jgi:glycosyltransferase involved in cell wall biosynthesis
VTSGAPRVAPLRITVVVDQFPELSETFIANEVQALRAHGHDVRVESGRHADRPNPAAAAGIDVAVLADDSQPERLRALAWLCARHPLRCARDLAGRRRWRREEGVRKLFTLAPAARRAARSRTRHLHAHFAAGAALDALRIGALLGLPYSVMTHGYDVFLLPANLREKHERAAFAATACDYSARHLREEFSVEARPLVVGVDPDAFKRSAPAPSGRTVVAVARLVEKKGLRHLIDATARIQLDRVVIVGDGPLRGELERHAGELGLGDVVEFAGERTPGQVRELLERADLLAAPSVVAADGDRDTMPVVVKEALAMEVPVVASDEVGLPEVVLPEWGRLVPPGDPDALAAAIDELLALPLAQRAAMGRAGRAFVVEHCNLSTETAKLAGWIAEVAGR